MALLFPNSGKNLVAEMIVNKTAAQNFVLKLFKSNTTPSNTDTAGTYTEADFTGYSAITLTGASWSSNGSGVASYAQQTFTCSATSSNAIYGYFVVQTTSGVLVYAERDASAPFNIANNGDNIKIAPTFTVT